MTGTRLGMRVVVVGAGIAGLAAARRLAQLGADVSLVEATHRAGGTIATETRGGFVIEDGADSVLLERPRFRALTDELGITAHMIGTRPEFRRSFIVRRGKLIPTPQGFYLLGPSRLAPLLASSLLSPIGKLRVALEPLVPRRRGGAAESLGSFVIRRFGREALDRLAQPMVAGIYGADPMELSLAATFPRFLRMEEEQGSVIRGLRAEAKTRARSDASGARDTSGPQDASGARYGLFASFDRGMEELIQTFERSLPSGTLRCGVRVVEIEPLHDSWRLRTLGPRSEERADAVVLAAPAAETARIVSGFDPHLGERIASIPHGSAATVSLGYREEDVAQAMDGAGFVVPASEGLAITGCTFCDRKYSWRAPEGFTLLRAYHGERSFGMHDPALVERTHRELASLLGITGKPVIEHVARFPGRMPRYRVGHLDLVRAIFEGLTKHPGLALAGNAYEGIGIPDCIESAERAAERLMGS